MSIKKGDYMEKKYSVYTQDEEKVQHGIATDLSADEVAAFSKLLLNRMDPNKPVDISVHPYIKL